MPNIYEQCALFPRSNRHKWSPNLKIFGRYSDREWITFVLLYLVFRIIKIIRTSRKRRERARDSELDPCLAWVRRTQKAAAKSARFGVHFTHMYSFSVVSLSTVADSDTRANA